VLCDLNYGIHDTRTNTTTFIDTRDYTWYPEVSQAELPAATETFESFDAVTNRTTASTVTNTIGSKAVVIYQESPCLFSVAEADDFVEPIQYFNLTVACSPRDTFIVDSSNGTVGNVTWGEIYTIYIVLSNQTIKISGENVSLGDPYVIEYGAVYAYNDIEILLQATTTIVLRSISENKAIFAETDFVSCNNSHIDYNYYINTTRVDFLPLMRGVVFFNENTQQWTFIEIDHCLIIIPAVDVPSSYYPVQRTAGYHGVSVPFIEFFNGTHTLSWGNTDQHVYCGYELASAVTVPVCRKPSNCSPNQILVNGSCVERNQPVCHVPGSNVFSPRTTQTETRCVGWMGDHHRTEQPEEEEGGIDPYAHGYFITDECTGTDYSRYEFGEFIECVGVPECPTGETEHQGLCFPEYGESSPCADTVVTSQDVRAGDFPCEAITYLILGVGTVNVYNRSFYHTVVDSVMIGETVEYIGPDAFPVVRLLDIYARMLTVHPYAWWRDNVTAGSTIETIHSTVEFTLDEGYEIGFPVTFLQAGALNVENIQLNSATGVYVRITDISQLASISCDGSTAAQETYTLNIASCNVWFVSTDTDIAKNLVFKKSDSYFFGSKDLEIMEVDYLTNISVFGERLRVFDTLVYSGSYRKNVFMFFSGSTELLVYNLDVSHADSIPANAFDIFDFAPSSRNLFLAYDVTLEDGAFNNSFFTDFKLSHCMDFSSSALLPGVELLPGYSYSLPDRSVLDDVRCAPCSTGEFRNSDDLCVPCTTACGYGRVPTVPCTASTDTICSFCPNGTYSNVPNGTKCIKSVCSASLISDECHGKSIWGVWLFLGIGFFGYASSVGYLGWQMKEERKLKTS